MTDEPVDSAPFNRLLGVEVSEWTEGRAVLEVRIEAHHLNRSDWVHGGVMMTMLDGACARAGCWAPAGQPLRRAQTISLTTSFLQPVKGGVLRAVGTLVSSGRSVYAATAELRDEAGAVIAIAQGNFKYRTTSRPDGGTKPGDEDRSA